MVRVGEGGIAEHTSPLRKVAILMVMIGDEASSAIMRQLDEDEVQKISSEIARVKTRTSEEAEGILEEFYEMAVAHNYVVKGGVDYARKVLNNAFGPEQAKRMLDRMLKTLHSETLSLTLCRRRTRHSWPNSFTASTPRPSHSSFRI
jgi:flagellar motor switch protein FliG